MGHCDIWGSSPRSPYSEHQLHPFMGHRFTDARKRFLETASGPEPWETHRRNSRQVWLIHKFNKSVSISLLSKILGPSYIEHCFASYFILGAVAPTACF